MTTREQQLMMNFILNILSVIEKLQHIMEKAGPDYYYLKRHIDVVNIHIRIILSEINNM